MSLGNDYITPKTPKGTWGVQEQAQKAGGGCPEWLRRRWLQSRAPAVLSLTPLERPLYWTSGRGPRLQPWPDSEPPVYTVSQAVGGGRWGAGFESYISFTAVCQGRSLCLSERQRFQ